MAGCASAPEDETAPADAAAAAPASTASPAPTAVAAPSAPGAAASASGPAPAPGVSIPVVDLSRQPDPENTGQVCRQMLKPNSNSIITVCGTPAQWKRYEQAEAQRAEELVLRMQRGKH
jgi:hypothetical protein